MNILVVGASGYVGSRLCSYLKSRRHIVHEIDHDSDCILSDSGLLKETYMLPSDCDCIIYLAQSPYYRKDNERPTQLLTVSVLNAIRLAELASHKGVTRYIYASTGNVYAPSFAPLGETASLCRDNWYSLSKIHAEEALSLYRGKLDLTIVRPFGIYGPQQTDKLIPSLLQRIVSGQKILLEPNPVDTTDRDGLRLSLCYIDDVVSIITLLASMQDVPVVNLASHENVSILEIAEQISIYTNIKPLFELSEKSRDFNLISDSRLLHATLPYNFISFKDGIKTVVEAFQSGGNDFGK